MSFDRTYRSRVGIPYRTRNEEVNNIRTSYDKYVQSAANAGFQPVEISLARSKPDLWHLAEKLDAFIFPGSPADVNPAQYGARRSGKSAEPDPYREETDYALLEFALDERKPVLSICYGIQTLNAFLGGKLVQDIASETNTSIEHSWPKHKGPEPFHAISIEPGSKLSELAQSVEARVNSSHHQSVLTPGRQLRITAHAPDGVVEAVEWTGDANWVVGVQWHPERMTAGGDRLARALFAALAAAASRKAQVAT
jgi:putative glutamine amidotransferase